jgi:predicted nuclease of predicted toxin-antitoxin system
MKFVADEGVDAQIVSLLRQHGHDLLYIAELAPGISDENILQIANAENRILITRDKDFGELAYRLSKVHSGIILKRLYELSSPQKAEIILRIVEKYGEQLSKAYTVVQPGKLRIRRLNV